MHLALISIIELIGIVQVLQIVFIFYKIENIGLKKNSYLYLFLLLIILPLCVDIGDNEAVYLDYPHLLMITYPTIFLYGPLFYFYVLKLTRYTDEIHTFRPHLIVFLFALIAYVPYFFEYSSSEKIAMATGVFEWDYYTILLIVGITVLEVIHISIYMALSLKQLRRYQAFIDDNYAAQKEIELRWLEKLIYSLFVVLGIYFIDNFANMYGYSLIESTLVLWIGFFSWLNLEHYTASKNVSTPMETETTQTKTENTLEVLTEEIAHFDHIVKTQQLYLEFDLTLSDLNRACNLPKHKITAILNQGLQTTFYDYINIQRIEHAKKLLLDTTYQGNVLEVSLDSGFKSRSAFYSAFKKYVNITPSAYIKQNCHA